MYFKNDYLQQFIEDNCLIKKDGVKLSSGQQSDYYFDLKRATLDGKMLFIIAENIISIIRDFKEQPTAIGGLSIGADPIISAVITRNFILNSLPDKGTIVRKEVKSHGMANEIENKMVAGTRITVVDDVLTTGKSIQTACDMLVSHGYEINGIIVIVDRLEGGKELLQSKYGQVYSLFDRNDFTSLNRTSAINNIFLHSTFNWLRRLGL